MVKAEISSRTYMIRQHILFSQFTSRSALHILHEGNTEKCEDNTAIYIDLTEEEIICLGNRHNKHQRLIKQMIMSASEYISIIPL